MNKGSSLHVKSRFTSDSTPSPFSFAFSFSLKLPSMKAFIPRPSPLLHGGAQGSRSGSLGVSVRVRVSGVNKDKVAEAREAIQSIKQIAEELKLSELVEKAKKVERLVNSLYEAQFNPNFKASWALKQDFICRYGGSTLDCVIDTGVDKIKFYIKLTPEQIELLHNIGMKIVDVDIPRIVMTLSHIISREVRERLEELESRIKSLEETLLSNDDDDDTYF